MESPVRTQGVVSTKAPLSPPLSLPLMVSSSSERPPAAASNNTQMTPPNNPSDETQLSQDLALFLANPSLSAALADGSLDLASYSGQVEDELAHLEAACITVYRDKQQDIQRLHTELSDCQTVLAALHEMLLGFQADLGGLSGDIRHLQSQSQQTHLQLENRKAAEEGLREFLLHVAVSPGMVHALTTGPVNATFSAAVQELQQLYTAASQTRPASWSCDRPPADTPAGRHMATALVELRGVAVSRIRDYFLQQTVLLRQPQTNVRMIQVHGLLKYASLYDFLQQAHPTIGREIFSVYCENMSKTLVTLFRTYATQLSALDATKHAATRQDVVCLDDAVLRDSLTTKAKKRANVLCLGSRAVDCLGNDSNEDASSLILAHVAQAQGMQYPYERLYKSLLQHLVDAVTSEHVFCRQFFKRDAFGPLFHATLSVLQEHVENTLFGCYDALCLLLLIKVTHAHKRLAHARTLYALDRFLDQMTALLWPRLKIVMAGHLRSLQQGNAARLGGKLDLHAHVTSRRFGEFACSLLLILQQQESDTADPTESSPSKISPRRGSAATPKTPRTPATPVATTPPPAAAGAAATKTPATPSSATSPGTPSAETAGDRLLQDLNVFLDEYVHLMERLAEEQFPQQQKLRHVFLINNLDVVICLFQERKVVGREFNRLVQLLLDQREAFVEEELLQNGFSKMIAFVQQTEQHLAERNNNASGNSPKSKNTADDGLLLGGVNPQVVEALVLDFCSNWKSHMEAINANVLSYFSNFRNGMEILKQVLTQLLLYYTRFQEVLRKVWKHQKQQPPFMKELVSTTVLLTEIKKYALAI